MATFERDVVTNMFEQHGTSGSERRQPDLVSPESRPDRIDRLPEMIAALPEAERGLAERLFQINVSEGKTVPPPEMEPWLEQTFGSVGAVLHQRIVRVINRWTFEGTTFNPLRSLRPGSGATGILPQPEAPAEVRERIERTEGDDFCDPLHHTPADTFGRIRGLHVTTAANVAKADGWHSVGIFDRHDPLMIDDELVADMLATVAEWVTKVNAGDPEARYPFVLWNCLWRAGASLVHGHVQMTLSHEMAHARVELLAACGQALPRRVREATTSPTWRRSTGRWGWLRKTIRSDWFVSLTPVKEREIVLLAPTYQDGLLEPVELSVLADSLAQDSERDAQGYGGLGLQCRAYSVPQSAVKRRAGEASRWWRA